MTSSQESKSLPWDEAEKAINKEIKWLKETILEYPHKDKIFYYCNDCIFRRLAILIISGNVKAKDIKSSICLWGEEKSFPVGKPHGKEWHAHMMGLISTYFKSNGYDITVEPNLNKGRADLGIYKNGERNLFIEVGTISLSKLLFNLESMEGSDLLLVVDNKRAVEFSIIKSAFLRSGKNI